MTSVGPDGSELAAPPATAVTVFGDGIDSAVTFARLLATDGVIRGLIGPREVDRLWDRHLVNSAVLSDLLPADARVVDVGSGAGLPGIPLALRRPDLRVDLVEPMLRRTEFLTEAVTVLGLAERVRVVRGRAEDREVSELVGGSEWVVARAVAPLDRLVRWCLPLLAPGGHLLALKGARAADEIAEHQRSITRLGGEVLPLQSVGERYGSEPTWVVDVRRSVTRTATRRRGNRG